VTARSSRHSCRCAANSQKPLDFHARHRRTFSTRSAMLRMDRAFARRYMQVGKCRTNTAVAFVRSRQARRIQRQPSCAGTQANALHAATGAARRPLGRKMRKTTGANIKRFAQVGRSGPNPPISTCQSAHLSACLAADQPALVGSTAPAAPHLTRSQPPTEPCNRSRRDATRSAGQCPRAPCDAGASTRVGESSRARPLRFHGRPVVQRSANAAPPGAKLNKLWRSYSLDARPCNQKLRGLEQCPRPGQRSSRGNACASIVHPTDQIRETTQHPTRHKTAQGRKKRSRQIKAAAGRSPPTSAPNQAAQKRQHGQQRKGRTGRVTRRAPAPKQPVGAR
jgi:hypothetical protein